MTAIHTTVRLVSPGVTTRSSLVVASGKRVCYAGGRLLVSDCAGGEDRTLPLPLGHRPGHVLGKPRG
jgi:hypothetical protein